MLQSLTLYVLVVLIWGSSWIGITYQLGTVPPEQSLVYRFALASAILFLYAAASRGSVRLNLAGHGGALLQGLLLFCLNYLFVYYGTLTVTSGLVAVLFSSIVLLNVVNERLFFGTPITVKALTAGLLGVAGIGAIFWPEISTQRLAPAGVAMVIIGTVIASLGNMVAIRNMRGNQSVLALNAWGMTYGSAAMAFGVVWTGTPWTFEASWAYVTSLLYLAAVATAVAFGAYLALIKRIGATLAAYSSILYPIVALIISSAVESFRFVPLTFVGIVITLLGNSLMLSARRESLSA